MRPKVIILAGPTASGKTALSLKLARRFDAEIISADSMQVYKYMDIGTAKPTNKERTQIPHHLLDLVYPDEEFDAAQYCSYAFPIIEKLCNQGKVCLVAGGTGLYIKALLGGLLQCPSPNQVTRRLLRMRYQEEESERIHHHLKQLDPECAARIHPNDRLRTLRALEIFSLTGRPPSELRKEHSFRLQSFDNLTLGLQVDRETLYRRIDQRTVRMIQQGLPEETESLLKKGYSPDLKSMQAIGYRHTVKYIQGEWSLSETLQRMQRDTRRYAKRQITWFKADCDLIWCDPENLDGIGKLIQEFLSQTP